jgi:hypothetical protein
MHGVGLAKPAIFLELQLIRCLPFILGGGIVLPFAGRAG